MPGNRKNRKGKAKTKCKNTYFLALCFVTLHRYCVFKKLKDCGNPISNKYISAIFPTALTQFISQCHILVILAIFQAFHYYYMLSDIVKFLALKCF